MEMSEKTDELFSALANMQGELENVHKAKSTASKPGDKFAFKYADLAACIDAAKPVLMKNGLAVSQLMGFSGEHSVLTTILTHSSGQWMRGEYPLEAVGMRGVTRAQDMGAAISYARRYCFAAIIGLAQEDDEAKLKKEQEQAEKNAAERLESERQAFIDGKRHAYQASPNAAALKGYHESTINKMREQGRSGQLSEEEFNLRGSALAELLKDVAEEKGWTEQAKQESNQ